MQAHGQGHGVERQHVLEQRFCGQGAAIRRAVNEVEEVERIRAVEAATDADPGQVQRAHVIAAAHDALEGFQGMHAGQLEVRLDVARLQAAQVFADPGRAGRYGHFAVGGLNRRVGQGGAFQVLRIQQLHDVHLRGVDRHGDLVRLWRELSEHVAGVIRQPFGRFTVAFRGEGNRAAHLDDHFRYRFAHTGNQFIELGQAFGAFAIEFAYMQVEHSGARFIAVNGLLDLFVHGQRNVFWKVLWHPFRAVRGDGDYHLFHVFRVQRIIEELHSMVLGLVIVLLRQIADG
ncbi:hypothetical protein D3C78_1011760 [compost metagenome]